MSNKRMGGSSVDANVLGVGFFDGTYQISAGTLANKQQTLRVSYAITPTDQNNYYANVPVVFATPFADKNYTVAATMATDYSQYPAFTPNTAVAQGYTIVDNNGMLQQVTTAGTTGPTVPVWSTGPAYSGTTTSGTAVLDRKSTRLNSSH